MSEQTLTLQAGEREMTFAGVLLGSATSYVNGKQRWAEVKVYRTSTGAYVVHGVGRSTREGEHDRHWAEVCPSARSAVERLYVYDHERDEEYLPPTNRIALEEAILSDAALRDAYALLESA